jgi:hypothetical protein
MPRAAAKSTATKNAVDTESTYQSVGALFAGKEAGNFQLKLEPEFLQAMGLECEGKAVTLISKAKVSKNGVAYHSIFLAFEDA